MAPWPTILFAQPCSILLVDEKLSHYTTTFSLVYNRKWAKNLNISLDKTFSSLETLHNYFRFVQSYWASTIKPAAHVNFNNMRLGYLLRKAKLYILWSSSISSFQAGWLCEILLLKFSRFQLSILLQLPLSCPRHDLPMVQPITYFLKCSMRTVNWYENMTLIS